MHAVPGVLTIAPGGHDQVLNLEGDASGIFSSLHSPMRTLQIAEYGGESLALQALMPVHLGIDKTVGNGVGQLLARAS